MLITDFSGSGIPCNSAVLAELTYLLTERIALIFATLVAIFDSPTQYFLVIKN